MTPFQFKHTYPIAQQYDKPVAYFSMEYAIHQPLKTYAGGLGYITGSFLRSAYTLKQNIVGVGILWKYGYYDQIRGKGQNMDVSFTEKEYSFLQKTNIKFTITINNTDVKATAYYLPPEVFKTAPLFLLSTDLPENEYWAQSICHKLYESNLELRNAAKILLGVGGACLLEAIQFDPEIYHINNFDAVPLAFYLLNKFKNLEEVKKRLLYTDYNMEEDVNRKIDLYFHEKINFFSGIPLSQVRDLTNNTSDIFDPQLAAIKMAGVTVGLSKMHEEIMRKRWDFLPNVSEFRHVTIAQNYDYWADHRLYKLLDEGKDKALLKRKKDGKKKLFEEVAEQTGQMFDENVLTLVWGKKVTSQRRPELLLMDHDRLHALLTRKDFPVQIIYAGKPHPMDYPAISAFDKLVEWSKKYDNFAVLIGHEMKLAKLLKAGADLWLNTQRNLYEASDSSGISAAMNGCVNFSTSDGWILEFYKEGVNSFIIHHEMPGPSNHENEMKDIQAFFDILEQQIIPLYYNNPEKWLEVMKNSMRDIIPHFDSGRMVKEYYDNIYNGVPEKTKTQATMSNYS